MNAVEGKFNQDNDADNLTFNIYCQTTDNRNRYLFLFSLCIFSLADRFVYVLTCIDIMKEYVQLDWCQIIE